MKNYILLILCFAVSSVSFNQVFAQDNKSTATLDYDNDGVADSIDLCPLTCPGTAVDKYGCPVDSDGDGLTDDVDRCPTEFGSMEYLGCPDSKYLEEETGIHNFPTSIKFKKDENDLVENEMSKLDTIVHLLMSNPTMSVSFMKPNLLANEQIKTDSLTTQRFNNIISFFIEKGIDESKLKIRSHYSNTEEAASKFHLIFIPWTSSSQEDEFLIKLVRFAANRICK